MKLYVGSRDFKPDGFKTVDIDPRYKPDILCDIRDMKPVANGICDEIIASAVLEHLEWPDGFRAISEFARCLKIGGNLKISVPDMDLMMRMIQHGDSSFHVMALVYGVGGRENPIEAHRYGYTVGMLTDILEVLGFGKFDWWNSDQPDASNGWVPRYWNANVACEQNVSAIKISEPCTDPAELFKALYNDPMGDFIDIAARMQVAGGLNKTENLPARVYQRIHYQLIDTQQRVRHLESELKPRGRISGWLHSMGL